MVQAEVHVKMEPSEPKVPIDAQKIDEPMDQVKHPPTPEDPVEQETEVSEEPLQVPMVTKQPKPMVPEQPYLRFYLCPDLCHCLMQYLKYLINPFLFKV